MNQITFGNYKSYDDLYLICTKKTIGSPSVKTATVNIEGGDGVLDYTEYFGGVMFNNRQLYFEFETIVPQAQFPALYSNILSALNGQKVHIVLDEDSDFYYVGRLAISDFTNEKGVGSIQIDCDCEPYKYKLTETVVTKSVSGTTTIILSNLRKRVVPEIATDAEMTIEFNGVSTTASAGIFQIPTLELSEGTNTVTVTGTGTITFTYREGCL